MINPESGFKTRKELIYEFKVNPATFDKYILPIRDKLDFSNIPKRLYTPAEVAYIRNYFNSLQPNLNHLDLNEVITK